jgi:hypothetical protein
VTPTPSALLGPGGAKPTFADGNGPGFGGFGHGNGHGPSGDASVYSASYGSGNLTDHRGPEIPSASFYAVYWNSSVANPVSATIQAFISAFGSNVSNYSSASKNGDLPIIQQYGSTNAIAPSLGGATNILIDSKATASSIADSAIRTWLQGLFTAKRLPANANTIYALYFPPSMKINLSANSASCTAFCGYHSSFSYSGMQIKYAVFPYPNCTGCSITGLAATDMLTIVTSHEIREAISDPLGTAWWDSQGYEADDKCVWHNLYKMNNGGFWVQPEYSNGLTKTINGVSTVFPGPGCIVP